MKEKRSWKSSTSYSSADMSYQYVKKFLWGASLLPALLLGGGLSYAENSEKKIAPAHNVPTPRSSGNLSPPQENGALENKNEASHLRQEPGSSTGSASEKGYSRNSPAGAYRPYLWIDCQKKGKVFQKKCFTQIKLVTIRMLESGEFAGVRSFSHAGWLYQKKKGVAPVSFVEFPPYKHPKMKAFAWRVHYHDLIQLAGEDGRYALIWVEHLPGRGAGDVKEKNYREWREMLDLYRLPHYFAHEPGFFKKMRGFYPLLGVLRIRGGNFSADDPAFWELFYRLERRLYAIDGIKRLYSPRHTLRSLSVVLSIDTEKRAGLAGLLSLWELAGEYGSLRLDPEKRFYEIAIYGEPSKALYVDLLAVAKKFFQTSQTKGEKISIEWEQAFSGVK